MEASDAEDNPLLASPAPHVGAWSESPPSTPARRLSAGEELLRTPVRFPLQSHSGAVWENSPAAPASWRPRDDKSPTQHNLPEITVAVPAWQASLEEGLPPWPDPHQASPEGVQEELQEDSDLDEEIDRFLVGLRDVEANSDEPRISQNYGHQKVIESHDLLPRRLEPSFDASEQAQQAASIDLNARVQAWMVESPGQGEVPRAAEDPVEDPEKSLSLSSLSTAPAPEPILTEHPSIETPLAECASCGRRFREDRLLVHEAICRKALGVRRGVFESRQQRLRGMREFWWKDGSSPDESISTGQKAASNAPSVASTPVKAPRRTSSTGLKASPGSASVRGRSLPSPGQVSLVPPLPGETPQATSKRPVRTPEKTLQPKPRAVQADSFGRSKESQQPHGKKAPATPLPEPKEPFASQSSGRHRRSLSGRSSKAAQSCPAKPSPLRRCPAAKVSGRKSGDVRRKLPEKIPGGTDNVDDAAQEAVARAVQAPSETLPEVFQTDSSKPSLDDPIWSYERACSEDVGHGTSLEEPSSFAVTSSGSFKITTAEPDTSDLEFNLQSVADAMEDSMNALRTARAEDSPEAELDDFVLPSSRLGPLVQEAALLCAQVDALLGLQRQSKEELEWLREKPSDSGSASDEVLKADHFETELAWDGNAPSGACEAAPDVLSGRWVAPAPNCSAWPKQPYDPLRYCQQSELLVKSPEVVEDEDSPSHLQSWLRKCAQNVRRRRQSIDEWPSRNGESVNAQSVGMQVKGKAGF